MTIRPETVALQNGSGSGNRLRGTVVGAVFLGSIVRLTVRCGSVELIADVLNVPHVALPAEGSEVVLGFAPEACVLHLGED